MTDLVNGASGTLNERWLPFLVHRHGSKSCKRETGGEWMLPHFVGIYHSVERLTLGTLILSS